ncbi:MAG TPA: hypothetical protein VK216_05175 [Magnetospirillaceae bacterium]|nr:hypothetical protein [Magnetospirillaceae bacterium]
MITRQHFPISFHLVLGALALSAAMGLAAAASADTPATQPPQTDVSIIALQPAPESMIPSARPGFSGQFGVPVDAQSIRFLIDGHDVSSAAYVSRTEFIFAVPYDLSAQQHTAEIVGKAMNGAGFDKSWTFATSASGTQNFLGDLIPASNTSIGPSFVVEGSTLPNAHVRIAASPLGSDAVALAAGDTTFTMDATAGPDGRFAAPITVAIAGPVIVRIVSIDPATMAGASATLDLRGLN